MSSFFRLHFAKLLLLVALANGLLLLYLASGALKTPDEWAWADIVGEGGSGVLTFVWLCLILNSRPSGRVTNLLACGLGLMFLSWWVDCLDEFIRLPDAVHWDHWLESVPMATGLLLLTYGLYHWHHEQLAISAQLKKRERVFREHRYFDQLTPLAGAAYLRRQIQLCLADQQPAAPVSLIAVDMDNFDSINQRFGYAEGDAVLQSMAQFLLLNLRQQDLLCRLAGDRFVILLPNTIETQAQTYARELQQAIAHFAYKTQHQGERLSLRASVAVVMAVDEAAEQLLQRLNVALARAKQPLALYA